MARERVLGEKEMPAQRLLCASAAPRAEDPKVKVPAPLRRAPSRKESVKLNETKKCSVIKEVCALAGQKGVASTPIGMATGKASLRR